MTESVTSKRLSLKNNLFDNLVFISVLISLILIFSDLNKYSSLSVLPISTIIFSNKRYHIKDLNPFLIILFIGFISSFFSDNYRNYFFIKDVLFFVQVPILITLGKYIGQRPILFFRVIKMFVLFYVIFITAHLFIIVFSLDEILYNGIEFHDKFGTNSVNAVLLFVITYFIKKKQKTLFSKNYLKFSILISVIYILISFSRTKVILLFVIFFIFNSNYSKKNLLFNFCLITPLFIQLIGLYFNLETVRNDDNNFLIKTLNSITELQITDLDNQYDITHYWRGFEAFLGIEKFLSGNILQILFGQGIGAFVEVPRWAFSDWSSSSLDGLKNISIFHNGYITILLKSGIIGLILFLMFFKKIFKNIKNNLAQAIIIYIVISTYLTHGLIIPTLNPFILIFLGISLSDSKYNYIWYR